MASSAEPRPRRRRGVLRHYRQPVWKDRLFWIVAVPSVLITALVVAVLLLVSGPPDGPLGWLRPVLLGVIVLLLSFRLLGAGVTTSRKFQSGLSEGTTARPGDLEAKGRAAGAVVGRAVKAAKSAPPSDTPSSRTTTPSGPGASGPAGGAPTTSAARAAGRAAGMAKASVKPRPIPAEPSTTTPVPPAPTAVPTPVPAEPGPTPPAPTPDPDPPVPTPDAVEPPSPAPTPAPAPAAAEAPDTGETVDRAARVVGSMIGRRLAERRRPPTPPN